MKYLTNGLTRWHFLTLAVMLGPFMVLTYLATDAGLDQGPDHNTRVWQATLGTITGPLTGAISRGFQRCCLDASLSVMLYCGPVLLIGILFQFIGLPDGVSVRVFRMSVWIIGWLVWFLGGIVSFGHALE